jgi:hypothetical protein
MPPDPVSLVCLALIGLIAIGLMFGGDDAR